MTSTLDGPVIELDGLVASQVVARLRSASFERWSELAAGCGHCARPVRLVGGATTLNPATGEVLGTYASAGEPDGVLYVRCGNRRASVCPSCSREYQGDMWHLLVAGAAGGSKGVPVSVATHPLVFATLTAPSFGPVHTARKTGQGSSRCRPRREKTLCPHGRPTWCMTVHADTDPVLGSPLCSDCYDYPGHVVWQWWAPELWRRFTIVLQRRIAAALGCSPTAARRLVRMQYAKVAEFQRRGLVHFHALIRLDGPPTAGDPFPAPTAPISSAQLAGLVRAAIAATRHVAPGVPQVIGARELRFGVQVDVRPVRHALVDETTALRPEQVAGYIAKYATKATEDLDPGAGGNGHVRAIRHTIEILSAAALAHEGRDSPYALVAVKWRGMLGFRGHFATKSRGYSTTLGRLRQARRHWQRNTDAGRPTDLDPVSLADDDAEETTLVIGSWQFAGMGWLTDGDAALAAMAAAEAREYAKERAQQRARSGASS